MENFNTHRQDAITQYIGELQRLGSFTHEDLLELESHLTEGIEDLIQKGLSWDESFLVAKKRLGKAEEVAIEYEKINGPFAGRTDFLYLVLGMGLFGTLYGVWNLARSLTWLLFLNKSLPVIVGLLFIIVFSLSILFIFHKAFTTRKYLQKLETKYTSNPIHVGVLILGILIIVNVTLYFLGFWLHNIGTNWFNYYKEDLGSKISASGLDISIWLLPVGIILSCLYLLYSKGEKKSMWSLFTEAGFVPYLLIGFGWEAVCSFIRHIMRAEPIQYTAIVYGFIFNLGLLFLVRLFKGKKKMRLLAFVLPALFFEGVAGFFNPGLCIFFPISQFFVWLVVGILIVQVVGLLSFRSKA